MSSSDISENTSALAACLEGVLATERTEDIGSAELQRLLTAAIRVYSTKAEREGAFPAVRRGELTATDAMITSSSLLQAVNVAVFELGLWQSWAR